MLSKEAEKKLQLIQDLLRQRDEINRQIENLLVPATVPMPQPESSEPPTPKRKGRKPTSTAPAERKPKGGRQFTDTEIEKMIRESDEGKPAQEIVKEYGFSSVATWYTLKSNYKKKKLLQPALKERPDFDATDDEEDPEDEPVVTKTETVTVGPKRYNYECRCGYTFKSGIPPKLIKCPDCMGKPKVVEEEQQGD